MIAVIFEVRPREGHKQQYLNLAAELKPLLAEIDGFVSIERFASLAEPEKILSLSFWRDEAAVRHWRQLEFHRAAQHKGRAAVFENYRLRVAEVVRDYGMDERAQVPIDSLKYHDS